MGRFLLLLLAAVAITYGSKSVGDVDTRTRQTDRVHGAYQESMARQAARSGFAIAERRLTDAPSGEFVEADVPLDGGALGSYDAEAVDDGAAMLLTVTGHYGDASHTFAAAYATSGGLPASIMIEGLSADWKGDPEEIRVDGSPHKPPSIASGDWDPTAYDPIGGISTATPALDAVLRANMSNRQRNKVSGDPDFGVVAMPSWVAAAVDEAPTAPGAIVETSGPYRQIGSRRDGSPEAPAVVVARAGARFEDYYRGYGVLVVHGDCTFIDDAHWEGLVIVVGAPGVETKLHIEDDAKIFGAVALIGVDPTTGAPVGEFTIRMVDNAKVFWSGDVVERLTGTLPALAGLFSAERTMVAVGG